jgi:hypothetical protein
VALARRAGTAPSRVREAQLVGAGRPGK